MCKGSVARFGGLEVVALMSNDSFLSDYLSQGDAGHL